MKVASRNHTVDIFRLIASFFIVFLHVGFEQMNENLVAVIRISGRWGVPFFFLLSGYFFQQSLLKAPLSAVKKTCIRVLSILVTADIIYIIAQYIFEGSFNWKHLFPGAYLHLWFLPSMILGTITVYFFNRLQLKFYITAAISFLIICIVLLADSYSPLLHAGHLNLAGRVIPLLSIPFMTIGTYFYTHEWFKKLLRARIGVILLIFGFALQVAEVTVIKFYTGRPMVEHQYLIGTLFLSLGVFILALSLNFKNETLGQWGKDFSLFIYLYHPLLVLICYQTSYKVFFPGNLIILFPVVIFLLTLLLSIVIYKYFHSLFLVLTGSITAGLKPFSGKKEI